MALLFADGFDLYASRADVVKSNWSCETASQTFSTTNGRFGGGCLQNTVANSGWLLGCFILQGQTMILSFAYNVNNTGGGATDVVVRGLDQNSVVLWRLEQNASGDVKIFDNAGVQAGSTAAAAFSNGWHWVEIKAVLGTSAVNGALHLYIDGVNKVSVTGIDLQSGTNPLAYLQFLGSAGDSRFDDVILMDATGSHMNDILGDCKIDTLNPNGDGASSSWTASAGADYQCVDDTPNAADDDSTYVSSNTAAQVSEFLMNNLSDNPTGIYSVQVRTRSRKENAGNRTYRTKIKSSATTENGTTIGPTNEYVWRRNGTHDLNPNGSVAWTRTSINALAVQLELVS